MLAVALYSLMGLLNAATTLAILATDDPTIAVIPGLVAVYAFVMVGIELARA